MADDIVNLRLSRHASQVANDLKDHGVFDDALTAAKFAMAYEIEYYWEDVDTLDKVLQMDASYESAGNNYNVGSVDPDRYIADLMGLLYPGITAPYRVARVIMCRGLDELGDLDSDHRLLPIGNNM